MAKRIDQLTEEQRARFSEWVEKWTDIGLKTEPADRPRFEENIMLAYDKTGLTRPKRVVWVPSPLVLAFAAPTAGYLLDRRDGAVRDAVDDAVDGAVRGAVGGAVRDAVDDAVDGAVRGAVGGAVRDAVDDAVRGAVGGAVRDAVRGAVGGAVRDAVGGAVRDAVRGAVGGAVRDAVDGAVRDAVGGAFAYIRNNWYRRLGGQFWVGGWWGSPSFVSFFTDVCELELSDDIAERARIYSALCESACWVWPHKDFVMVCERPREIHRNEAGRLHYDHGAAIAWEGYELFFLHGVRFEKDLYWKVVNREIGIEDILKNIPNADQRSVALVMADPQKFLKQANATLVSTGTKPTRAKEPTKLYEVPNFMETGETEYAMTMFCPSTGRPFLEWVEPAIGKQHDADLAQATAFGISKAQYLAIAPGDEA
jgi:hypothetical protein